MHNFQGYFSRTFQDLKLQFPGLSRTKVIFQDFPGPGIFKKKIQDFPGGVGTLLTMKKKMVFDENKLILFSTTMTKIWEFLPKRRKRTHFHRQD